MISLATVSVVLMPFLDNHGALALTVFLGTAVGSLIPDSDSKDAAIFHSNVKGLNGDIGSLVNNLFAPVFPVFGYATKYAIYKPAVIIYDKTFSNYSFQEKHRSFSHSILGVLTMTAVTGLYITPLLIYLNILSIPYLTAFLTAYMAGAFMHMLEDSCTKTGISWNAPFSSTKLKGKLTTSSKPEHVKKPRYLLYTLGILSPVSLIMSTSQQFRFTDLELAGIGFLASVTVWLVFMIFVAGVRFQKN